MDQYDIILSLLVDRLWSQDALHLVEAMHSQVLPITSMATDVDSSPWHHNVALCHEVGGGPILATIKHECLTLAVGDQRVLSDDQCLRCARPITAAWSRNQLCGLIFLSWLVAIGAHL